MQLLLEEIKTSHTSRIYSNIYKTSAVKALVAMNQDLTQDDFARAMEVQFRGEHDLRNIGLARDMVLQFMYPIEGNEAAVGFDYRTLPDQLEAVELALSLNEIVLAGPLTLVQGGEGLIARIPIEIRDPLTGQDQFWGFASVVMNSDSLFAGAGLQEDHGALKIAIRGRDALGAKGEVFWGDPVVFENNPLTQLVELPYGNWQIAAIPTAGWGFYSALTSPLMLSYLVAAFAIQQDITERKKDQELLRRLATIDELSQLYNRRYFMELTRDAFVEAINKKEEFAVLLIDIDRFKAVNDNYGHAAGDTVIRELGLLIKKWFHQTGIFGRLGGEEFGVHLPKCSIKEAVELADSFLEELAQMKIVYDKENIKVTVSIGVSGYASGVENYGLILRQADEALYKSKLHGRNRVSVAKA